MRQPVGTFVCRISLSGTGGLALAIKAAPKHPQVRVCASTCAGALVCVRVLAETAILFVVCTGAEVRVCLHTPRGRCRARCRNPPATGIYWAHWHLLGPLAFIGPMAFIGPTGIYWANGIYWAHWQLHKRER